MPARRTQKSPGRKKVRKKTTRRRSSRAGRGAGLRRLVRRAAWVLALVAFGTGFFIARNAVRLDRVVQERFEGRLFRVPSRVLSAPTILYPGLDHDRIDLRGSLVRLGYREQAGGGALAPGRLRFGPASLRIHRRAFEHPTRPEPAREVVIRLDGPRIDSIHDAATGREIGALLLEPELVGSYYGPDREQRDLVQLSELPPHVVDAVLAVEDQRFLQHRGIDFRRVAGALWVNLRSGRVRQGGSTITQQLVKNFFLTPERSFERKAQEALMSILLEARYEKEAILEAYLNEIYLGQRGATAIHGIGEAARLYFGKPAHNLSASEAALLAAIIQSPNGLSPHREAEAARERRDLVLRLMARQGRIEPAALEAALAEPLGVAEVTPEPREARYFLDALRRQLPEFYGPGVLTSEGLRVYSTLDLRLQRLAARTLREGLEALESARPALAADPKAPLQACLIALQPQTGAVLALVGGRSYSQTQFDRCTQARRPSGSIFKPFVYAAALEPRGGLPHITLASRLDDSPLEVSTPSGPWRPANYDGEFHDEVSVRMALERSMNVATARLGQQVGIDSVVAMARRLGVTSALPRVPSLAIGSADLSPLEVARAYATLAAGGTRPAVRTFEDVVDGEGHTVERQSIEIERMLDEGTAFLVTSLLQGVVERGTGRGIRAAGIEGPVAAKTGTSDEERDAWFVGYTPELVVAVWVGFDEPRSMGLAASRVALPLWASFVGEATGGRVRGAFLPPADVARLDIDPLTGARALLGCPRSEPEYFLHGTEPRTRCPEWGREGDEGRPGWLERLLGGS